jgi:hypothetical protein
MSLDKTQVIEHLLGLCRSDIEKRYGEQALDIHNAKLTFEKNRCVRTLVVAVLKHAVKKPFSSITERSV